MASDGTITQIKIMNENGQQKIYDIYDVGAERTISDLLTIRSNAQNSLRFFSCVTSDTFTITPTANQVGNRILGKYMVVRPAVVKYILFITLHVAVYHDITTSEWLIGMDIGQSKNDATDGTHANYYSWPSTSHARHVCTAEDQLSFNITTPFVVLDNSRWFAYAGGINPTARNKIEYSYRALFIGCQKAFQTQENSITSCWRDVC